MSKDSVNGLKIVDTVDNMLTSARILSFTNEDIKMDCLSYFGAVDVIFIFQQVLKLLELEERPTNHIFLLLLLLVCYLVLIVTAILYFF